MDRKRVAEIIFADTAARATLNGIIHPRIGALTAMKRTSELASRGEPLACYERRSPRGERARRRAFRPLVVVAAADALQIARDARARSTERSAEARARPDRRADVLRGVEGARGRRGPRKQRHPRRALGPSRRRPRRRVRAPERPRFAIPSPLMNLERRGERGAVYLAASSPWPNAVVHGQAGPRGDRPAKARPHRRLARGSRRGATLLELHERSPRASVWRRGHPPFHRPGGEEADDPEGRESRRRRRRPRLPRRRRPGPRRSAARRCGRRRLAAGSARRGRSHDGDKRRSHDALRVVGRVAGRARARGAA